MEHYLLRVKGEERGPYVRSQIENMWNAGTITSDSAFSIEGSAEWKPITEFFLKAGPEQQLHPGQSPSNAEKTSPSVEAKNIAPEATSGRLAYVTLVLGCLAAGLHFFAGLPAMICGHRWLSKNRGKQDKARKFAVIGLVVAYVACLVWGIIFTLSIALDDRAGDATRSALMREMQQILNTSKQDLFDGFHPVGTAKKSKSNSSP